MNSFCRLMEDPDKRRANRNAELLLQDTRKKNV